MIGSPIGEGHLTVLRSRGLEGRAPYRVSAPLIRSSESLAGGLSSRTLRLPSPQRPAPGETTCPNVLGAARRTCEWRCTGCRPFPRFHRSDQPRVPVSRIVFGHASLSHAHSLGIACPGRRHRPHLLNASFPFRTSSSNLSACLPAVHRRYTCRPTRNRNPPTAIVTSSPTPSLMASV